MKDDSIAIPAITAIDLLGTLLGDAVVHPSARTRPRSSRSTGAKAVVCTWNKRVCARGVQRGNPANCFYFKRHVNFPAYGIQITPSRLSALRRSYAASGRDAAFRGAGLPVCRPRERGGTRLRRSFANQWPDAVWNTEWAPVQKTTRDFRNSGRSDPGVSPCIEPRSWRLSITAGVCKRTAHARDCLHPRPACQRASALACRHPHLPPNRPPKTLIR
jgi:hypothetical protein